MRKTTGALMVLSCALGTWAGCSPKKQTEIVPGVSTQVRVPKDMKSVRLDVNVNGQNRFCNVYDVTNGVAHLPRTLGLQSGGANGPVKITVTGFRFKADDPEAPTEYTNCDLQPTVSKFVEWDQRNPDKGFARILRSSRMPYVADRIVFLPMPLRFSCFEVPCGPEQTCQAGKCVDLQDEDPSNYPDYNDSLIFGNSNTCFRPSLCLVDAVPPIQIDPSTCKFVLPGTQGAPDAGPAYPFTTHGTGLNVRAYYDDGSYSEVLDLDPNEGFFVPDPNAPQTFQLAPNLCHPAPETVHRVAGIVSSGLCPPKTPFQPICDDESPANPLSDASAPVTDASGGDSTCSTLEIKPAHSALIVVMDHSDKMKDNFYGESASAKVLGLSLKDPVFTDLAVGLKFFPDPAAGCGGFTALDDDFKIAADQQPTVAAQIADLTKPFPPTAQLDAALNLAYGKLGVLNGYNKRAALVISNGAFANDCGGTSVAALAASHPEVSTYVIYLGGNGTAGLAAANALASAGHTTVFDASVDGNRAGDALTTVKNDLATCLYELPGANCVFNPSTHNVDCSGAAKVHGSPDVTYYNELPPTPHQVAIHFSPDTCNGTTDTGGWSLDGQGRIRICGSDCSNLQDLLKTTFGLAAAANVTPPAIPLHVTDCGDQPQIDGGAPITDAGPG